MGRRHLVTGNATLNMSGGTIQNNQAISGPVAWNDAAAGEAFASMKAERLVSGGLIQTTPRDGRRCQYRYYRSKHLQKQHLVMTGGTVTATAQENIAAVLYSCIW